MKQSGDLDFRIIKEVAKLSEIEFLGLLNFLNISLVEETNPIDQSNLSSLQGGSPSSNSKNSTGLVPTEEKEIIDKNSLDTDLNKSLSPRAFQDLLEELGEVLGQLNRNQKRNLYRLIIKKATKGRTFKGNQNFLKKE